MRMAATRRVPEILAERPPVGVRGVQGSDGVITGVISRVIICEFFPRGVKDLDQGCH